MSKRIIGFIGGSGVYQLDALDGAAHRNVDTPWGAPSSPLIRGKLSGVDCVFLARHGQGHRIAPSDINYRANIAALKQLGVTDVFSISACGSFREALAPGSFVIVDQYIDFTTRREKSFFGPGFVAHLSMADPVCPALCVAAETACQSTQIEFTRGGTYLCIDGPQFSTRAESHLFRSWGCDVIGMTNMPEARLAREAELPYASIAMVTDYDCWRETEDAVEVANVLETMRKNSANAARLVSALVETLGPARERSPLGIESCLDHAVITPPEARDPERCAMLSVIIDRFIRREQSGLALSSSGDDD